MRTNIVLDDKLVKEAFHYAPEVESKRELIHLALREFVERHSRRDVRELKGKIKIREEYDHKILREGREK